MARGSLLSLLGLYNYDNTIFNNLVVPNEVNKEVLINNILLESAELEVLFTDPDTMKFAIGEWSKRRLQAWTRISNVLYQEYDPFINIKRDEERTITQTRDLENTNNSTAKGNVNAWDDDTEEGNLRDTNTINSEGTDTGTIVTHEKYHIEGDSAITDAQDVLKKEVQARQDLNIYNFIIKEFIERFCLLVY